ncbi:hypothetical protein V491_01867, partial [Pseudogymnoascus sp. VKM F-3775]
LKSKEYGNGALSPLVQLPSPSRTKTLRGTSHQRRQRTTQANPDAHLMARLARVARVRSDLHFTNGCGGCEWVFTATLSERQEH